MSRTRIFITEVPITKAGQIKNFQIKLPGNAIKIIGVANDLRMGIPSVGGVATGPGNVPTSVKTPTAGSAGGLSNAPSGLVAKIILQSLEKANLFYWDRIWSLPFMDGIGSVTEDPYAWDAFQLLKKADYKTVSIPAGTTILNGILQDLIGAALRKDIAYTVKVLLWIETDEKEIKTEKNNG
jgi:hypothetical protein